MIRQLHNSHAPYLVLALAVVALVAWWPSEAPVENPEHAWTMIELSLQGGTWQLADSERAEVIPARDYWMDHRTGQASFVGDVGETRNWTTTLRLVDDQGERLAVLRDEALVLKAIDGNGTALPLIIIPRAERAMVHLRGDPSCLGRQTAPGDDSVISAAGFTGVAAMSGLKIRFTEGPAECALLELDLAHLGAWTEAPVLRKP